MGYTLTRFVVLTFSILLALAGGARFAHAGGNRMGGTGLYLTHSAETLTPGGMRAGAFGEYVRYVVSEDPETYDLAPQFAWSPVRDLEFMFAMPLLRKLVTPDGNETGIGDGVVGLKYRFLPNVAALTYVSLPFGDDTRSLGSGGTDVGFAGILSFPLGANLVADFNAGYQLTGVSGVAGDNFLFYGFGVSVPVGASTTIFGEISGRVVTEGQTHDTVQFDVGVRHQLNDRMSLTVGGGRGLRGDYGPEDPELRLFAGFDILFGAKPAGAAPTSPRGAVPAVAPAAAVKAGGAAGAGAAAPAAGAAGAGAAAPATGAAGSGAAAPAVGAAGSGAAAPMVPAPAAVAAPVVTAAPAHTAQEIEAAKKRLAAAEILFEYDRTRLTPEGERALQLITADMAKYPEISFVIEGHADNRGTSSYNKILGMRRAEMVMRYMVKAGIAFDRLKVVTQGEMKPKVPNKDARGMALNRRVVFSAL